MSSDINWSTVVKVIAKKRMKTVGGVTVACWGQKTLVVGIRISEAFCKEAGLRMGDRVSCYITVDRKGFIISREQDGEYMLTQPGGTSNKSKNVVFRMQATDDLLSVFGFSKSKRKPYACQCAAVEPGVLKMILPQVSAGMPQLGLQYTTIS